MKNNIILTLFRYFILLRLFIYSNDGYTSVTGHQDETSRWGYNYQPPASNRVTVDVYYEPLCPSSKREFPSQILPLVSRLFDYINIRLFPFGNAHTVVINGHYHTDSQNGPAETYGSKLHACALQLLDTRRAVFYIACMMRQRANRGSDNNAAFVCGPSLSVDASKIVQCALSERSELLLKNIGDITAQARIPYVPVVFVNGRMANNAELYQTVCNALGNLPSACRY